MVIELYSSEMPVHRYMDMGAYSAGIGTLYTVDGSYLELSCAQVESKSLTSFVTSTCGLLSCYLISPSTCKIPLPGLW